MREVCLILAAAALLPCAQASWYWPFGSDDEADRVEVRLSDLMEPASSLIDEASDLASENKVSEAVEKYRAALGELDRIERENPDRAQTPEFASLKVKRQYVNASIDSLLMKQVQRNEKPVAVSDTEVLEARLRAEREEKAREKEGKGDDRATVQAAPTKTVQGKPAMGKGPAKVPLTKREVIAKNIAEGNYAAAEVSIKELLAATPNDLSALNLRAAMEAVQGKFREAEASLDQAILSHPRNYYSYYNMARLMLQANPANKSAASKYYESGRTFGGPEDLELEAALK